MPEKLSVANFGSANGSLATVGYTILNPDLTTQKARTTSGVSEVATGSGIYSANVGYPNNFKGIVLWDTGGATPKYAAESLNPLDPGTMADEMRTLLRSLNTSLSAHLERLFGKQKEEISEIVPAGIAPDLEPIKAMIETFKSDIEALGVRIGSIKFNPMVSVNADTSKFEESAAEIKKETEKSIAAIKDVVRAIQGGIEGRIRASAEELGASVEEQIRMAMRSYEKSGMDILQKIEAASGDIAQALREASGETAEEYGSRVSREIGALRGHQEETVKRLLESVLKQLSDIVEGLKKSSKDELLETILKASGAIASAMSQKQSIAAPEYTPLRLSLAGRQRGK